MDSSTVSIVILSMSNALLLAALLWLAVRQRRLDSAARKLVLRTAALDNDVQALCAGAGGAGAHLSRLQQQLVRLCERQDRLELNDSQRREYDEAVRLVRAGCDIEQLVAKCRLGRAEAELLVGLYGGQRRQAAGMVASGLPM
jgi:hypothetical protein